MEAWKIKRELLRVWMQIEAPISILLSPVTRVLHDLRKSSQTVLTEGAISDSRDLAVYLIFSPRGLLGSHIRTVGHLCQNGFAPFVIVNHPLSKSDRDSLAEHSWKIMERPNVGYDFGGYRDAALYLLNSKIFPETLLFVNDSVWFPVADGDTLLEEVRAAKSDIYGFAKDRHKRSNKPDFVQSFFFAFKGAVIHSESYRNFWSKMYMFKNKWAVIRLLEMRLSPYFESHGFRTDARFHKEKAGMILSQLDVSRQIAYLSSPEAMLGEEAATIATRLRNGAHLSPDDWDELARKGSIDGYILKCSPELLFGVLNVPMLKKHRHGHFIKQRAALVQNDYHLSFFPEIAEEVEVWDAK